MRILHLLPAQAPLCAATLATWRLATRIDGGVEHHTWLLGGSDHPWLRHARQLPGGLLAAPGLIRQAMRLGPADVVMAWSPEVLRAASLIAPRDRTVLAWTTPPTDEREIRKAARCVAEMVALSPEVVRRIGPIAPTTLIRPGVAGAMFEEKLENLPDAGELRSRWGAEAGDCVVALLSDPADAADARAGIMALGIACRVLGARRGGAVRHVLLVHPRQHRRAVADRLLVEFGGTWRLGQDAQLDRPWELLHACDAAMVPAGESHAAALAWALAAGCPVVMPAPADDGLPVLPVRPGVERDWADALVQLLGDSDAAGALRRDLGGRGRAWASGHLSVERAREQWLKRWRDTASHAAGAGKN